MKVFRRIVFFLFAAVFLIGAPRLVFYALGYSFKAGTDQGIVKSGLIFISTAPPGAAVFVGGRRYRETTPAIIRDLMPGQYPIRVVLKDYYPWARNVPVEAGKAAVLGHVLLRPKQPDWKEHVPQSYDRLIPIPETHDLLLYSEDRDGAAEIYNWKTKKRQALFVSPKLKLRDSDDFYVASGSSAVLAAGKADGKFQTRWAKIGGEESSVSWSDRTEEFTPLQFKWDARDERYIFAYDQGRLKRADLYQKNSADFLSGVRGYALDNRRVLYFSGEDFLSLDVTGKSPKAIWKDTDRFLGTEGEVQVIPAAPETVFFITDKGRLVTNHPPRVIAEEGVKGIEFDKKNNKLLFWTDQTVGVAEWIASKKDFSESSLEIASSKLFSGARQIQAAFWAHDGTYAVYQDQDKVFLLEPQAFAEPLVYELFEVKSGSLAFYSDDSGEIYYLDKKTGHLMSLELIPKWKVMEVPLALILEKEKEADQ
jgi:hypothetical protein